jgi:hypothetical protein
MCHMCLWSMGGLRVASSKFPNMGKCHRDPVCVLVMCHVDVPSLGESNGRWGGGGGDLRGGGPPHKKTKL